MASVPAAAHGLGEGGTRKEEPNRATEPPSHYFAKGCKVGIWEERTLKFLAELFAVRELAERVATKLKTAVTRYIYQQVWRGVNVERWADMAAEAGEHKAKYFTWLCRRESLNPHPCLIKPRTLT
jgi:hypothetical protein